MNDVITLYEIVPVGDGIHYVCRNPITGEFYRTHKATNSPDQIVFFTKETAQEYIDKHMGEGYLVEEFGYNIDYLSSTVRKTADLP